MFQIMAMNMTLQRIDGEPLPDGTATHGVKLGDTKTGRSVVFVTDTAESARELGEAFGGLLAVVDMGIPERLLALAKGVKS